MRQPLDRERIDRRLAIIRELFHRSDARAAYPPVPEAEIAALEAAHGLRLPENYRRYLLEFGEPGGALMHYGPRRLADQPGPRSALPFPLDRPWAGPPEEITDWEEEQESDFFEDGPGEFYAQFDDPRTAFYELPGDAAGDDGTLNLGATRSHMIARLVLNGPWAGSVWFDSFGYDGGLLEPADHDDACFDARREFFELDDRPGFAGLDDPAPGDFLDLTIEYLHHRAATAPPR